MSSDHVDEQLPIGRRRQLAKGFWYGGLLILLASVAVWAAGASIRSAFQFAPMGTIAMAMGMLYQHSVEREEAAALEEDDHDGA